MNILKKTLTLLLAIIVCAAGFAQKPDRGELLPTDNNFKIGKLENGLTYYIRHSANPSGRAEFFIVHNVGSLQEDDNQRGLAHFLEHMAFNGTKNFPGKKLLEYFAGIGVKFGANINAYTSMERTVYNISEVPVSRSSVIDSALLALHDWSHYISCEPTEIEAERGVVREEWRRGDDARTRMMKGITRYEQYGSRFAQRDVIGDMDVINNFSRETLIDYYHKWYRPDLQAVIVIGDIDPLDIEKRIKERFSAIPKVENGAVRESYTIPNNSVPIVGYHTDPESKALSVRMTIKIPNLSSTERAGRAAIYDELTKALFLEMYKVRCQVAAESPDSLAKALIPVMGAISYASGSFTTTALPLDNKSMAKALRAIFTEVERVREHGFEKEEFDAALPRVSRQLDANYARNKDMKSVNYVSAAVDHFTRGYPLLDNQAVYNLTKEVLKSLTVEDINEVIDRIASLDNRVIIFAVPESDKELLPNREEVLSMLDEIRSTSLDKFSPVQEKSISNINPVLKGEIIKTGEFETATEWRLSNGAKVIWKEYTGKDKQIRMRAFRKGGLATKRSIEDLRLLERNLLNFSVNGLNKGEYNKWCSVNGVNIRAAVAMESDEFSGSFEKRDAQKFFNLLHLFFTDISMSQKDAINIRTQMLKNLNSNKGEVEQFKDSVYNLKFPSNPIKPKYSVEYVNQIDSAKLNALYKEHFSNPYGFTFVFSGPMNPEEGRELIEKYLASVKGVKTEQEDYVKRYPSPSKGDISLRYSAKNMLSTKASITREYHGVADYTSENSMLARYVTYILRDRYMKSIREEKGGTYHVGVSNEMVKNPSPICRISVEFDTDPALVNDLLEIVQLEIDKLVEEGPLDREMKEITLYLNKVFSEDNKEVNWTGKITDKLMGNIDISGRELEIISKIDSKKVHNFAKKILTSGNRATFIFEPQLASSLK